MPFSGLVFDSHPSCLKTCFSTNNSAALTSMGFFLFRVWTIRTLGNGVAWHPAALGTFPGNVTLVKKIVTG